MMKFALIGAASGWGAQILETEQGPQAMKDHHLEETLLAQGVQVSWRGIAHPPQSAQETSFNKPEDALPYVNQANKNLAALIQDSLNNNSFPVVIGGDHSIAVGTWSALTAGTQSAQNFGLIWMDAHMDAHTHETSPSTAYHGMPVAALLGHGEPSFVNSVHSGPKLKPEHVVLMGIRDYEPEEENLLLRLGVRIIKIKEIREKGFDALFQEALERVQKGTTGFGMSIDLDAFDPKVAPGVGTPAQDGLMPQEVLPHLKSLKTNQNFKGLEITELNPALDKDNKTVQLVEDILISIFA